MALRRCKHRLPADRRVTSATSGPARGGCIWRSTIVLGPMADKVSLLDLHSRPSPVVLEPMANNWLDIGWAVSNRMKRDPLPGRRFGKAKSAERGAIRALKMAIRCPAGDAMPRREGPCDRRRAAASSTAPLTVCLANRCRATDRGSQYCAHDYQKILRQHGFQVSPLADVNIRCPSPGRACLHAREGGSG